MRILGLDVGQKRIGAAISDELGITAQGLDTVRREDRASLEKVIKDNKISEIIVGLPLNMDGTKGKRAEDAILFAEGLKERFSLPVKMWDERLTTRYAEREMIKGDLSRRKRRRLSDKVAAQLILQGYLDSGRLSGGQNVP